MGIGVAQGQEARTHRDVRRRAAKPRLTRTPVDRHPRERFVEHTLQIVIQAALDVAAHIVSDERLGEPRANRELFDLLERHAWIGAPLAASLRNMVGFRNVLVHGYDDVNLAIAPGEMVSIIGPSGSGKSTLLNLVGGLDRPTSGQVRIDGEALSDLSDDGLTRVRRDKIGFIFQFFNLLPTLTCLENVGLPLHLRGWARQKVDARARELLALVQLGPRLQHLPEELSGGERQRVAIARALSVYPPIILADEPTGNLDTQTAKRF